MPNRRDSLYEHCSDSCQPFLTAVEQNHALANHRQAFFQERHDRRDSFNGNRRMSSARRRLSSSKTNAESESTQETSVPEDTSRESNRATQGYDRHRAAGSHLYCNIYLIGDLTKLSPESVSCSRHSQMITTLGGSPIYPVTNVAASSNGCIALLNDRGQLVLLGNVAAFGILEAGAFPGSGYRDIAMLYSILLVIADNGFLLSCCQTAPGLRPFFSKTRIRQVASSDRHAALVTEFGELYTFGCAQGGALGHGTEYPDEIEPRLVHALQGQHVRTAACGVMFTVIMTEEYHNGIDGNLSVIYSWGIGCGGRLGHGDLDSRWIPTCINSLSDPITAISCGDSHCLALSNTGTVFSWGENTHGQLGYSGSYSVTPRAIVLGDIRIAAISAGRSHSAAVSTTGVVYVFGSNHYGQLAIDKRQVLIDSTAPMIANELADAEVEKILCKANFTVVVARGKHSNSKPREDALREHNSPADEYCHMRPLLELNDCRHIKAGLPSRSDFYTYIVVNEILASLRTTK